MMPRYQKKVDFLLKLDMLNVLHQMQDAAVVMNPKSLPQVTLEQLLLIQIHLDLRNRVGQLEA